jgi:hypothetical protein
MPPSAGDAGQAWLAALPEELTAQRRVLTELVGWCEAWPFAARLEVGCSLGRGAADALSDIDAALGVAARPGPADAPAVDAAEAAVAAALPRLGPLVDVLRDRAGPDGQYARRVFAQFAEGTQLDLAVVADAVIQARHDSGGAPDFVALYRAPGAPPSQAPPSQAPSPQAPSPGGPGGWPDAYSVTGEQIRQWAFEGWCALLDLDKYLRRGSLWEAHARLHEARHHIWALWATARGAQYPWHGLSQVLDHDPGQLPPGIESTVAGLEPQDLRRAARAAATVLAAASEAAARRVPADLPEPMAAYVTARLRR